MSILNIKTSEQVSKYHPDKIADQISDYLLETMADGVGGIETLVKGDTIVIAGEVKTVKTGVAFDELVLEKCAELRYFPTKVINLLEEQSTEIKNAVFTRGAIGAGDQGFVYGYAERGNEHLLSHDMFIANSIIEYIEELSIEPDRFPYLKGDAKTQVFINEENAVVKIIVSAAHGTEITLDVLRDFLKTAISNKFKDEFDADVLEINPAGAWNKSGPYADAGLTGRKIVADQYGGRIPVGGGAFSGKDLTKVDRSGAYALRKIAVDLIKARPGIKTVLIEAGYIIGKSKPYSLYVVVNGIPDAGITKYINDNYDLTVNGLIDITNKNMKKLNLTFSELASGNHMKRFI